MARPGILYVEVKQAAEEMVAKGISPTIERLRQRLGAGSFSTISKHMKSWRAERQSAAPEAPEPPPDAVGSAVDKVWQELQRAAEARAHEAEERAAQTTAQAQAEAERQVAAEKQRRERAEGSLTVAESQLAVARDALALETERARRLEVALAEARTRIEGGERLVTELRRETDEARRQGAEARRLGEAMVAELRVELSARLAALTMEHATALERAEAIAAAERARTEELGEARAEALEQLGHLRAQLRERSDAALEERRAAARESQALQGHVQSLLAEGGQLSAMLAEEHRQRQVAEERNSKLLEALRALERRLDQQHDISLDQLKRSVAPLAALREGQAEILALLAALRASLERPGDA